MNSLLRPSRLLRTLALACALTGAGVWLATGAHVGWTQTSVVTMQRDEVTGIDFPVRRSAFIAGLEVPAVAAAIAAGFFAASFLRRRQPATAS